MDLVFATNDDMYLRMILSGEITGTPEAHIFHIGYPVGVLLSYLYRLFPNIPWYGIFLFLLTIISLIVVSTAVLSLMKTYREKIVGILFIVIFAVSFFGAHIIRITYTTTAIFVGAAALLLFYTRDEKVSGKKFACSMIPTMLLYVLSLFLRFKAGVMLLPFWGCFGVAKIVLNHKSARNIVFMGGCILLLTITGFGIFKLSYNTEEWKNFTQYDNARTKIYDYEGFPTYRENADFYEKNGISEYDLRCAQKYYMLLNNEEISEHVIIDIAKYIPKTMLNVKKIFKDFIYYHLFSYVDRPFNIVVYGMYLFCFILILIQKEWKAFVDMLMLFCGRMTIWIYLLYGGRILYRITQGIYFVEFFALIAICFRYKLWRTLKRKKAISAIVLVGMTAYVFLAARYGIPYEQRLLRENRQIVQKAEAFQELKLYFAENRDNLYLCDMNSFTGFTEGIFEKPDTEQDNFLFMGSWLVNSPWYDQVLRQYDIDPSDIDALTKGNIYFAFQGTDWDYFEKYYKEKISDLQVRVENTYITANGMEFYILRLQTEEGKDGY